MEDYTSAQSHRRFDEVCTMMKKNSSRFLDMEIESTSSSSEDETADYSEIKKTWSLYEDNEHQNLEKVKDYIQDVSTSGALVCLICIETVRKKNQVWSCESCYCIFHLNCIQKWAKDCLHSTTKDEKKSLRWSCPKCRKDYTPSDQPKKYYCFCGKVENPSLDSWTVPHSCGKVCDKTLKPPCGHNCCLLCHPGPCPPCAKTVLVSCCCSKSKQVLRRCSDKEWLCGKKCGKILSCNTHFCDKLCHKGVCPPCQLRKKQSCQCGRNSSLRPCFDPVWKCTKVCNKLLKCGFHYCNVICHSGPCLLCPDSGSRTCPCGKLSMMIPCTEKVSTCGDTCNKILNCGLHHCSQRCHYGPCETCIQMRVKKCRCGLHEKSVPCFKEYVCNSKCKRSRDCGRHNCNKKCCPGNCPPCEAICGKTLNCGAHKCTSLCHSGPCFPCREKIEIFCSCGSSKVEVLCGKRKTVAPPKCLSECKVPPDCHHPARQKHKCHYGKCPSCRLICNKTLKCNHTCPAKCHSAFLTKREMKEKSEGPWDLINAYKMELISKLCPPCLVPVPVTCLGGHETRMIPCYYAKEVSCGKICGRDLSCGNHKCNLECHKVKDKEDFKQSDDCEECFEPCQKPRKEGCNHPCKCPCHPGECSPCKQHIKMKCHCQINMMYILCNDWTSKKENERISMLSCSNRCPKKMTCGHRCIFPCHPGDCADKENCKKKVTIRCPCKRIKKEIQCSSLSQSSHPDCDQECLVLQNSLAALELSKAKDIDAEKKRLQEKELQEFLRKTEGKKKKKKRLVENEKERRRISPIVYVVSVTVLIFAIIMYFYHDVLLL